MHNCKASRERLTELLLDGSDPRAVMATDLRECTECREEFGALSETLRVATRLIENATPPESYWPSYHAKLRQKLARVPHTDSTDGIRSSGLTRFFAASVRVPVPVGIAAILGVAIAFVFTIRVPTEPRVVHVPVEVPVIQERPVERIVYREKRSRKVKRTQVPMKHESTLASLEGFKPADEVKLTVIKGGSANEK